MVVSDNEKDVDNDASNSGGGSDDNDNCHHNNNHINDDDNFDDHDDHHRLDVVGRSSNSKEAERNEKKNEEEEDQNDSDSQNSEEEEEENEEQEDDDDKEEEDKSEEDEEDQADEEEESEDENFNNDGRDNQDDGISEYERLRLERIKRNQQRLAALGLQGKEGSGILGGAGTKKRRKRRSANQLNEEVVVEKRERLSRKSKTKKVDYTGELQLGRNAPTEESSKQYNETTKLRTTSTPKENSKKIPMFIYQEFQRIKSARREHIKQAKRYVRLATREVKYWSHQLQYILQKEKNHLHRERIFRQQQLEASLLNGKTQWEVLHQLEQRLPQFKEMVSEFDQLQMTVQQRKQQRQSALEEWNQKHTVQRKINVIEAVEVFPQSFMDAITTLNALLLSRSPMDNLPPPRRSKRSSSSLEQATDITLPQSKRLKTSSNTTTITTSAYSIGASRKNNETETAATVKGGSILNHTIESQLQRSRRRRSKDARNVGGWISPYFARQLDRSWLERTRPLLPVPIVMPASSTTITTKAFTTAKARGRSSSNTASSNTSSSIPSMIPVFDLYSYVPQAGDIVLFYPSSYRDYLQIYPDTLGSKLRNILRVPLWVRARRELRRRLQQQTQSGTTDEDERVWYTQEWIASLTTSNEDDTDADDGQLTRPRQKQHKQQTTAPTLGDYPIICQVVRTHAEFPPDPFAKGRSIVQSPNETTIISWEQPLSTSPPSSLAAAATKTTTTMVSSASVNNQSPTLMLSSSSSSPPSSNQPKHQQHQRIRKQPQIRLAVILKPLTKIIPSNLDAKHHPHPRRSTTKTDVCHNRDVADLHLPPNFSVLTFPIKPRLHQTNSITTSTKTTTSIEPFLIPFCYAYTMYHSLALQESVWIRHCIGAPAATVTNIKHHHDENKDDDTKRNKSNVSRIQQHQHSRSKSLLIQGQGRIVGFASAVACLPEHDEKTLLPIEAKQEAISTAASRKAGSLFSNHKHQHNNNKKKSTASWKEDENDDDDDVYVYPFIGLKRRKRRKKSDDDAYRDDRVEDPSLLTGEAAGEELDPFGLIEALEPNDRLAHHAMEWQHQQQQTSVHYTSQELLSAPKSRSSTTMSQRGFRLEDWQVELEGIVSKFTDANDKHTLLLHDLEEELKTEKYSAANIANSSGYFLPIREASIVVNFLAMTRSLLGNLKKPHEGVERTNENASTAPMISLMDFIHSTLPIRQGITVSFDANRRRHSHSTSPWHLVPLHPTEYVRTIQQGFLGTLDKTLREKALMGLQDLVKQHQSISRPFLKMVPEDDTIAPGYYCAVPVAMFFDRIFARLKADANGNCYYSSMESILMDLSAISENCLLFNSPDSDLVISCNAMITQCKKFIVDLFKTKQLLDDDGSRRDNPVNGSIEKRSTHQLLIPFDLNAPYNSKGSSAEALMRNWFQRITPDGDGTVVSQTKGGKRQAAFGSWVPQCGDNVLYSLFHHKDFISGHRSDLADIQCFLPTFRIHDSNTLDATTSTTSNSTIDTNLEATTMTNWLIGTVVSVRATFPLAPATTGKVQCTFDHPAPILAVEVQLHYHWSKDTVILFWRPCHVGRSQVGKQCPSCGLAVHSFLVPNDGMTTDTSPILQKDLIAMIDVHTKLTNEYSDSMKRGFDLLMRRALSGIPPASVNPSEALNMAERNVALHHGSRTLPSFEEFLLLDYPGEKKQQQQHATHTRGGAKKSEDIETMLKLAESCFLPPWSAERLRDGKPTKKYPKYDTLLPSPAFCLELVRLRASTGYYRTVLAVVNDISEAYVSSVWYILSGPASRKTNRISIRKIAKFLASSRGSPKMPRLYYKTTKKTQASNETSSETMLPSSSSEKIRKVSTFKNRKNDVDNDDTALDLPEDCSPEEESLICRINLIRSFYAMAVVFATKATAMETLFCLKVAAVPPPPEMPALTTSIPVHRKYSHEQLQGIQKIRWVIQAIEKDAGTNRFPFPQTKRFRLKILCGGQRITEHGGELQDSADGATYYQPSSTLARMPDGNSIRLRIAIGGETVCGDKRPVARPDLQQQSSAGWPALVPPVSATQDICDSISLGFQHFENNDGLARALFGLPGRRFPCVRCQLKGLSTLQCRVQRAHSNLDFSILEHFQGTIGVDSLLLPWQSERKPQENGDVVEEVSHSVVSCNNNDEKVVQLRVLEEEERQAEATRAQRSKKAEENLDIARQALKSAEYLSTQADLLNNLQTKLSEQFVRNYFPVDPEDNHYVFCIHCGSAGNLLLCEGCSNVAHPECADLKGIPEGDWFCPRCVKGKGPTVSGLILPASADTEKIPTANGPKTNQEVSVLEGKNIQNANDTEAKARNDPNSDDIDETTNQVQSAAQNSQVIDTSNSTSADDASKVAKSQSDLTRKIAPPPPSPEINDEEFEAKEEELASLIEGLSSQRDEPKPKTTREKASGSNGLEEDHSQSGKRKRGRPPKRRVEFRRHEFRGHGDPMQMISGAARSFLASVSIETAEEFLATKTSKLGRDLILWRKKQGMPMLKNTGHIATVSCWKTIVRNAGGMEYLSDDSGKIAETVPQDQPQLRASIENRSTAVAKVGSSSGRGKKRPMSESPETTGGQHRPTKRLRTRNTIKNLPAQGQQFCAYLQITDAEDFLSRRTSTLADALVRFRRKERMIALAGSGPSAYVAMWKSQLRREVGLQSSLSKPLTPEYEIRKGSKVRDVEEVIEATSPTEERIKLKTAINREPRKGSKLRNNPVTETVQSEDNDDNNQITFDVLEETKKLVDDDDDNKTNRKNAGSEQLTPAGKRRRVKTNRFQPL